MSCACSLFAGIVLGWCLGSRKVTHQTHLVFPRATDPVVIEVDRARIRTE